MEELRLLSHWRSWPAQSVPKTLWSLSMEISASCFGSRVCVGSMGQSSPSLVQESGFVPAHGLNQMHFPPVLAIFLCLLTPVSRHPSIISKSLHRGDACLRKSFGICKCFISLENSFVLILPGILPSTLF